MATSTPLPTTMTTATSPLSSGMPPANDTAQGGQETSSSNDSDSNGSLVNYYFVFLALIVAVAGLSGILLYRRRKRAIMAARLDHHTAYARDHTTRRREMGQGGRMQGYWHQRFRSQEDVGREEGLNELGEAPPAYAPKRDEAVQQNGLAVPLQTLAREDAGLKPPDYEQTSYAVESPARRTRGTGEGSSQSGQRRLIV